MFEREWRRVKQKHMKVAIDRFHSNSTFFFFFFFTVVLKDWNRWLQHSPLLLRKPKQYFWANSRYRLKIEILSHENENLNPSVHKLSTTYRRQKYIFRDEELVIFTQTQYFLPSLAGTEIGTYIFPHDSYNPKTRDILAIER